MRIVSCEEREEKETAVVRDHVVTSGRWIQTSEERTDQLEKVVVSGPKLRSIASVAMAKNLALYAERKREVW